MRIFFNSFCVLLVSIVLQLILPTAQAAVNEEDLLPIDQAFALSARPTDKGLQLQWNIADGYYLYRHRIKVTTDNPGIQLGNVQLPAGKKHHDEFFGDVETYRQQLKGVVTLTPTPSEPLTVKVNYQGCADVGVCYPPHSKTLTIHFASDTSETSPTASGDAGFQAFANRLGNNSNPLLADSSTSSDKNEPLPEAQAFQFEAIAHDGNTLLLRFTSAPDYYLYRDQTAFKAAPATIALQTPQWPQGTPYKDAYFGETTVYFNELTVPVDIDRTAFDGDTLQLTATFQGCQKDGICYPPMTRTVDVHLPPAADEKPLPASLSSSAAESSVAVTDQSKDTIAIAEDSKLAAALAGPKKWLALLTFFIAGIGLAMTPCVLPMIPILSGLIAGQGKRIGTARAFQLSLIYVLANAFVFTLAGIIAGYLGASLQTAFQTPWVLVLFALLFIALALSSFGLYEIQPPAFIRNKLASISNQQRGGSLSGVAVMGALSALIVGPCVAPPLAGAVLYIGQTKDPILGGAALFILAMGMGIPLILFGIAAGRGIPTTGNWMIGVQRVFGFVFLGLAIWMLSRILPGSVILGLWGALFITAACWLWTMRNTDTASSAAGLVVMRHALALVCLVIGLAQMVGALAGSKDIWRPLAGLLSGGQTSLQKQLPFKMIKSVADLDRELATAQQNNQIVMFDFYADWCVACKEMERDTFSDQAVHTALKNVVLLKADVTANDEIDQELMKRFGIIGPPATLFFKQQHELRGLRLVGYERTTPFLARIKRVENQ